LDGVYKKLADAILASKPIQAFVYPFIVYSTCQLDMVAGRGCFDPVKIKTSIGVSG